ncbi:hypothetical protein VTK73DRAFT_3554 [Phialemonium thermophilum]|uniref:Carboxylic ester hydrolase n=1 Tax=Phialemonium thermophilum TaxID=223376 RepID=A0ABR3XZN4_9PEZI
MCALLSVVVALSLTGLAYGLPPWRPTTIASGWPCALFLAPGVMHCGGGVGAQPTDGFTQLIAWVENGTVPKVVPASGTVRTRNLSKWTASLVYSGSGNLSDASSWTCA